MKQKYDSILIQQQKQTRLKTIEEHINQSEQTLQRYHRQPAAKKSLKINTNHKHENINKNTGLTPTEEKSNKLNKYNLDDINQFSNTHNLGNKAKYKSISQNDQKQHQTILKKSYNHSHRRNKTQMDKKHHKPQRDPISSCLFVPFLDAKQPKGKQNRYKSLQKKYKLQLQINPNNNGVQLGKGLQNGTLQNNKSPTKSNKNKSNNNTLSLSNKLIPMNNNKQRSNSKYQKSIELKETQLNKNSISLPSINKYAQSLSPSNKKRTNRVSINQLQKKQQLNSTKYRIQLGKLDLDFKKRILEKQKAPSNRSNPSNPSHRSNRIKTEGPVNQKNQDTNNNKMQKNIKSFKVQNREKKIITNKKVNKKTQKQWKEIDYLQLKTCYYHIQKKLAQTALLEENKLGKTQNYVPKDNQQFKSNTVQINIQKSNIKNSIRAQKLKTIPLVPKLPSSSDRIAQIIKNYQSLSTKTIDFCQIIKKQKFHINFKQNQSLYFGQLENQIPNGYGVFIQKNIFFEGHFVNGHKNYGVQVKKDTFYQGQFYQNKKSGYGIYYWNSGKDQYSGQWLNGEKNGNGVWKNFIGDEYIGQWVNGKVQGYGVHSTIDGQKYQGYFVKFLKQGKGKQSFPNGDSYSGSFFQGKPQGLGIYKFKRAKAVYQGQFSRGFRHGKGKLTIPGVLRYEGQFKFDCIQGTGKLYYNNEDSYIGGFKDGKFEGNGSLHKTKQNKTYIGLWKNGVFFDKKI